MQFERTQTTKKVEERNNILNLKKEKKSEVTNYRTAEHTVQNMYVNNRKTAQHRARKKANTI